MIENNFFDFVGGHRGQWQVLKMQTIVGEALPAISHLNMMQGGIEKPQMGIWCLKGFTSNVRYAEVHEREKLRAVHSDLGRKEATLAALIPIKKNEAWWTLAQDERRKIFEAKSKHTETGLKYLPAIARKLFHCRDIGEPFDFLTWFEYDPQYADSFEELVHQLRKTEEWKFVDREIDIRLSKYTIA